MKKVISIIMAIIMMFSLGVSVSAATPDAIEPYTVDIAEVYNGLGFTGTAGTASSDIFGHPGTTYISATLTVHVLQGTRWVYVGSDSGVWNGSDLYLQVDFTGVSESYYRSMLELTVVRNGVTETETEFKYAWC